MPPGADRGTLAETLSADRVGYGRVRYAAGLSLTAFDAISLFTEASVALTGFAAVASAFAGRDRRLTALERVRTHSVIALSASTLAGCLAFITVQLAFGNEALSARLAAGTSLLLSAATAVILLPKGLSGEAELGLPRSQSAAIRSALVLCAEAVFFARTVCVPTEPGWLALGFSLQLLHSLWMFVRLLTRRDEPRSRPAA